MIEYRKLDMLRAFDQLYLGISEFHLALKPYEAVHTGADIQKIMV